MLLIAYVARHGGALARQVRICGPDAVGVGEQAVGEQAVGEQPRRDLGVADGQVAPAAVVAVLAGPREVCEQHPAGRSGRGSGVVFMVCGDCWRAVEQPAAAVMPKTLACCRGGAPGERLKNRGSGGEGVLVSSPAGRDKSVLTPPRVR